MAKLNSPRFTVILTEIQIYNLGILILETGKSKADLIKEEVDLVLKKHDYPIDKKVKFIVTKI